MRVRLWAALASALTVGTGLIVLVGLLLTEDLERQSFLPNGIYNTITSVSNALLQLATITIALTLLIGILNLVLVHLTRVAVGLRRRRMNLLYSLTLLISFAFVIGLTIRDRDESLILLDQTQRAVESALAGMVFFALVYGAYRALNKRVTWSRTLFIAAVLVVLLAALPIGGLEAVQDFRDWLYRVPVSAGARGLLLGIALGTIVTGVRVLIGVDRSYRE